MTHRFDTKVTVTPEMIASEVASIRDAAGDDELAHSMENDLHQAVLLAISERRCEDVTLCAHVALETLSINFDRWCA